MIKASPGSAKRITITLKTAQPKCTWFEHRAGRVSKEKYLSHLNKQTTPDKVVVKLSKMESLKPLLLLFYFAIKKNRERTLITTLV